MEPLAGARSGLVARVEEAIPMSQVSDPAVETEITDRSWRTLYAVGGAPAVIAVLFFRRNIDAELIAFRGFGLVEVPAVAPQSAVDWFTLLHEDKLVGLALLGLVDLVNYLLVGLVFLAAGGALRRTSRAAVVVAMACSLVGIAVYLASNQAFALLSLSGQYAAASGEKEQAGFLAAGEALLAIHNPGSVHQGTGIYASLFLVLLAGLILSLIMLRSRVFSRATAWVGIVANGVGLLYFPALALFATFAMAPALLALPHVLSAPFRELWYLLIALRLFRLARDDRTRTE
jgi:hypothetical protein